MTKKEAMPPKPFKSDGCTLAPRLNFKHCCIAHDRAYWMGGTRAQRKETDIAFRNCISAAGHPALAQLYYAAVRAAGSPMLPVPWRWGFGWPWPKGYDEI